jgi:hypothetical protein
MKTRPATPQGRLKNPGFWAAAVLTVSFFLPWLSNPQISAAGYDLEDFLRFFSTLEPVAGIFSVLVYLIPAGGLCIMILVVLKKSSGLLSLITAMGPLVMFVVLILRSPFILSQMQVGMILTLAAALILLITGALEK